MNSDPTSPPLSEIDRAFLEIWLHGRNFLIEAQGFMSWEDICRHVAGLQQRLGLADEAALKAFALKLGLSPHPQKPEPTQTPDGPIWLNSSEAEVLRRWQENMHPSIIADQLRISSKNVQGQLEAIRNRFHFADYSQLRAHVERHGYRIGHGGRQSTGTTRRHRGLQRMLSPEERTKLLAQRDALLADKTSYFGAWTREYFGFLLKIQPEDELWEFIGPEEQWLPFVSYGGIVILRDGEAVDSHITIQS